MSRVKACIPATATNAQVAAFPAVNATEEEVGDWLRATFLGDTEYSEEGLRACILSGQKLHTQLAPNLVIAVKKIFAANDPAISKKTSTIVGMIMSIRNAIYPAKHRLVLGNYEVDGGPGTRRKRVGEDEDLGEQ